MQFGTGMWGRISLVAIGSTLCLSFPAQAQVLTFQGTTSGQWGMPSNPSGSTFLSGENGGNNNRLTWGRTDSCSGCTSFNNYVQYDGLGFQAGVGSTFRLGDLSYRNGSVWDPFNGDFPLDISLNFSNPALGNQNFSFLFNILNTPNVTGNAVLDGDRLRFSNSGISSQSFTLGNTIYNLQLIGFSSDGGNTLVSEFNSPEGTIARASLYGQIQAIGTILPPPSPPSPAPVIAPSPEPVVSTPSPSPEPIVSPGVILPLPDSKTPANSSPSSVPEPATGLAALLGLGLLIQARRRNN
jgi:MYXO-CTERM domain-containing protein